ncbi:hypothetical protein C2E23DRAFT_883179 [Lenzites betulinus]|nr:hypothetical protein C2E23DRAFT_883179 [Lenzites betulinus]
MQNFTALLAVVGLAFLAVVRADAVTDAKRPDPDHLSTSWKPTATVVETHTFTGTRIEQHTTNVPPYLYMTTFPITWTQTQTNTVFSPVPTDVPDVSRRHARDFEGSS